MRGYLFNRGYNCNNQAGIVLDLSHLSPSTALDSISLSEGPTIISHTTARTVYHHPRGSSDGVLTEMVGLPRTLVGVLAMTFFLDPKADSLAPFIDHIRHIAALVGPDKVAIGSDGPVGGFTDPAAARRKSSSPCPERYMPSALISQSPDV